MKKVILVALIALSAAFVAAAQEEAESVITKPTVSFTNNGPRAIGGRFGYGGEVSYQHNLGKNFIEVDLGTPGWVALGVQATAAYNFVLAQPQWTPGTWTVYAGPGLQMGMQFGGPFDTRYFLMNIGVVGQVGLSYRFEFPLELSVDLRPGLGGAFGSTTVEGERVPYGGFYFDYWNFIPSIGVRYAF